MIEYQYQTKAMNEESMEYDDFGFVLDLGSHYSE